MLDDAHTLHHAPDGWHASASLVAPFGHRHTITLGRFVRRETHAAGVFVDVFELGSVRWQSGQPHRPE